VPPRAEGAEGVAAARALFFQYDGSRFYLAHDDRLSEYDAYGVPEETEAEWMRELTRHHLDDLHGEKGWWSVRFLIRRGELGHLSAVAQEVPAHGKPWTRRAYLDEALAYWDACARWTDGVCVPPRGWTSRAVDPPPLGPGRPG
jgi:hypothetical protein